MEYLGITLSSNDGVLVNLGINDMFSYTNVWTHSANGVHPSNLGFLQIADALWAFLKANAR